jgi:hypothetical protein
VLRAEAKQFPSYCVAWPHSPIQRNGRAILDNPNTAISTSTVLGNEGVARMPRYFWLIAHVQSSWYGLADGPSLPSVSAIRGDGKTNSNGILNRDVFRPPSVAGIAPVRHPAAEPFATCEKFSINQTRKIITSVALMRAAAVCPRFSCISLAERAVMIDVIS